MQLIHYFITTNLDLYFFLVLNKDFGIGQPCPTGRAAPTAPPLSLAPGWPGHIFGIKLRWWPGPARSQCTRGITACMAHPHGKPGNSSSCCRGETEAGKSRHLPWLQLPGQRQGGGLVSRYLTNRFPF